MYRAILILKLSCFLNQALSSTVCLFCFHSDLKLSARSATLWLNNFLSSYMVHESILLSCASSAQLSFLYQALLLRLFIQLLAITASNSPFIDSTQFASSSLVVRQCCSVIWSLCPADMIAGNINFILNEQVLIGLMTQSQFIHYGKIVCRFKRQFWKMIWSIYLLGVC